VRMTNNRKMLVVRGKPMPDENFEQLKADARTFRDSAIWQVIQNEIKFAANKRMFERSQTTDDILFGKVMLYVIDIINKKLQNIAKL